MRTLHRLPLLGLAIAGATFFAGTARAGGVDDRCGAGCGPDFVCRSTNVTRYVPGYVQNAQRGDLIFHKPSDVSNDLVGVLMRDMGIQRTHIGMITAATTVRHDTRHFSPDQVPGEMQDRYGWGHVSPGDIYLDPNWLKHGAQGDGLQDQNVYDAFGHDTATVMRASTAPGARDATLQAASRLESMSLEYRLFGFTDVDAAAGKGGSMCSGSIYLAFRGLSGGFTPVSYSPDERNADAWRIYGHLVAQAQALVPDRFGLTDTGKNAIAMGVARQVVNCFAFDACGARPDDSGLAQQDHDDFASGWNTTPGDFHYIDTGSSISPDDIYREIQAGTTSYDRAEDAAIIVAPQYDTTTVRECVRAPEPTCFVAGTMITMADGSEKPIERVAAGDHVLSFDEVTKRLVAGEVKEVFVHPSTPKLVRVNGALVTTPEHPFYVEGEWLRSDRLALGMTLARVEVEEIRGERRPSLHAASVTSLEALPGGVTTYNFEVGVHHDYFAGGLLVHNRKRDL